MLIYKSVGRSKSEEGYFLPAIQLSFHFSPPTASLHKPPYSHIRHPVLQEVFFPSIIRNMLQPKKKPKKPTNQKSSLLGKEILSLSSGRKEKCS